MEPERKPPELIGQSPAFHDALSHASAAAELNRPLLIIGERGSGKELLAGRIHFLSPRWEAPFVTVNCAALSEDLLDSELFGHEAGAFTGARARHRGRFERAEGGTLFLDEIASASLRVQEKLLRVIEYGDYDRVGGEATRTADVRIIAAANVDLPAQATAGKFRADLLDRLAFDVIAAPPLRARKEDIPVLAAHFASAFANEMALRGDGAAYEGFAVDAMAMLVAYDWPGNVRELRNAAERSLHRWVASGNSGPIGEVVIDPFENAHRTPASPAETGERSSDMRPAPVSRPFDLRARLDEIELNWAKDALAVNHGSQTLAARHLGLTYDQMRGLVRKHGLAPERRAGS